MAEKQNESGAGVSAPAGKQRKMAIFQAINKNLQVSMGVKSTRDGERVIREPQVAVFNNYLFQIEDNEENAEKLAFLRNAAKKTNRFKELDPEKAKKEAAARESEIDKLKKQLADAQAALSAVPPKYRKDASIMGK